MRETVGSLRVYFLLVGGVGVFYGLQNLVMTPLGIGTLFVLVGIVLSAAYGYVGFRLEQLIVSAPSLPQRVVFASIAVAALSILVTVVSAPSAEVLTIPALLTVGEIAIGLYLVANVRRLSSQAVASLAEMAAPAWYPDPLGKHELRYWDGIVWTPHVSDAGMQSVDEP